MALPTKPSENLPDWDVTTSGDFVEPSAPKKLAGYASQEPLPYQHFNWLLNSISYWLQYLVDATDELITQVGLASRGTLDLNTTVVLDKDTHDGITLLVDNSGDNVTITLPAVIDADNMKFTVKDITGDFATYSPSVIPDGAETIEGLNANYLLEANFGQWNFYCDGSEWFLI